MLLQVAAETTLHTLDTEQQLGLSVGFSMWSYTTLVTLAVRNEDDRGMCPCVIYTPPRALRGEGGGGRRVARKCELRHREVFNYF